MKRLNIKNRLTLALLTSLICYILDFLIFPRYIDNYTKEYLYSIDFIIEITIHFIFFLLLIQLSIFYSKLIFQLSLKIKQIYRRLYLYSLVLLIINNATAFLVSYIFNLAFEGYASEGYFLQYMYVDIVLVTFITVVYSCAFYLESMLKIRQEKEELEIKNLKDNETAIQAQLIALRLQLDPHFMFNNYSILSELIEEDQQLATKFLNHLSKMYRYILQHSSKNFIEVEKELKFLSSYLYLIEIRYGKRIAIDIDAGVWELQGNIPPVVLQLLIENAIKHNCSLEDNPLKISIYCKHNCQHNCRNHCQNNYLIVENNINRSSSDFQSTKIGQRNIIDRYTLLGAEAPTIEITDNIYRVSLPIFLKQSL